MAGIVLATGRALGETMAVVMVCGNVVQVPNSLFDPVRTLTANIGLEMGYAMSTHRSALFFSGLMLMALVAVLWRILLAAAMPGIAAGLLFGIGRAIAETAALIFTSGYVTRQPDSLFDSGRALSVHN